MRLFLNKRGDCAVVLHTEIRVLDQVDRDQWHDVCDTEDANLRRLGVGFVRSGKVIREEQLRRQVVDQFENENQIHRVAILVGSVQRHTVGVVFHVDSDHREAALQDGRPDGFLRGHVGNVGNDFANQLQNQLDYYLRYKKHDFNVILYYSRNINVKFNQLLFL